ncbi:MAG: LysM peptidoglycan-binding domain-containing protein [Phycisphaerae bacterium]|nr:LysM peptidoglycan-binding domain-containing protein [Phycisphaerae bacterium]
MTTDAKIGLLLALLFIVAITFVINGLPEFLNKTKTAPDTAGYINHYKNQPPALVGQSRNIANTLDTKPVITVVTEAPDLDQNTQSTEIRYQTILPAAQEAVNNKVIDTEPAQTELIEVKIQEKYDTVQSAVYEVLPGDSLAKIAQKFYGTEQGNRLINIEKIFNANKDKLESIDSVQVGQKLIIPTLENQTDALLKTGLFEKVTQSKSASKEQFKFYTIRESDSLWQIAARQLGDGNRYKEILQLNKAVLTDADTLVVGTKIKLPAK